ADSPHHMWREDLFAAAQSILDAAPDPYSRRTDQALRVDGALATFVDVLRSLDAEGTFGPKRSGLVLCVWMGDQSNEDRIDYAARLNPKAIARRFEEDLESSTGSDDEDE